MPMKAPDAFRLVLPLAGRLAHGWRGFFLLLLCLATPARALEPVTLQLNFTHQFQFAGYYAAIEQGYYREAGLEVKLVEGGGGRLAEAAVLAGQAEYGVGNSSLLLSRLAGKPVVVLAVVFQHSPSVLLMRQHGGAPDVRKLVGAPVMIGAATDVVLAADEVSLFLAKMGVAPQQMRHLPPSYRIEDLIDGKVDAIAAYSTNEPDYLDRAGFSYYQFTPRTAGIDFYGDNLFTSEHEMRRHPERVKAFRAASLRGWQYAMAHREEMARVILAKYSQRHDRAHLLYEAQQMELLLQPVLVELGYMNPQRWQHIADTYASMGVLPRNATDSRVYKGFLYRAVPGADLGWLYLSLGLAGSLLAVSAAFHFNNLARERRRTEDTIRQGELRFRTMFEEAPMGIALIDTVSGQFLDINPRYLAISGRSLEHMKQTSWMEISHPDDVAGEQEQVAQLLARSLQGFRHAKRIVRPDGGVVWVDASVTAIATTRHGGPHHLCMLEDVTDKRQTEALIWQQANFDTLTQLPNRRMFHERLRQALAQGRRDASRVAILFIDLDHFKEVNDTLGHHQGDILLIEAARRIRVGVRETDTVARLGGDEFTVILSDLDDLQQVDRIARQILDGLLAPFLLGQEQAFVSASIGITLYPDDAGTIEDLLKQADQAMYVSKGAGRNRYSYFTPAMQVAAVNRMRMGADLRTALREQQMQLYYQPIVELHSGKLAKAEALLRWHHPQRGVVCPPDFLALAESSGLIVEIGDWVLHTAAAQLLHWRAQGHAIGLPGLQLCLNQSPLELQREVEAPGTWLRQLMALDVPASAIVLDMREDVLLPSGNSMAPRLQHLREAGLQIALDDFGSGHASLTQLQQCGIDYLKLDGVLVRKLAPGASELVLCEAIVTMAHKLGLQVIAEGVETEEQRARLLEIGCDFAQGELFAPPLTIEAFDALLHAQRPLHP
ncbi:EAL domain-containing protein [Janthinobacterium lividum]|uniref:EAL domain-containing protein n=1 Tax=Janthinobacterium lividum TaxID=29581 RepID=A0ABU0Y231_9BURK|nr:EAL domain-containing protein [Janthinobacterium lividum]MDQ4629708.1 EAL domain-containing protein [Janthinobacterium lividum]MDQ4677841.1 EAL domain-containing protein [Janthinobacterium lividum]MDQ4688528.1 EAL domain-containing protein [Janthinobacterium lividum]